MTKRFSFLLMLSVLAGCDQKGDRYYSNFELDERSFSGETIEKIEQETGINIPTGARGLNFFYKAPIDPGIVARIEIPRAARPALLRRLEDIKVQQVNVRNPLGPRFKWWTPTKGTVLIARQGSQGLTYLHVVLTEEDGRTILYPEWAVT